MIQMDIPAAYVCAQIFAYCGQKFLADKKPSWSGRYTLISVVYALGIIGACGLYLYSGWTEWEMMYWVEGIRIDNSNFGNSLFALVAPLFLVSLGIASGVGFMLAHRWIVDGKPKKVVVSIWIGIAISIGMVILTPSAPMIVGRYHNYHAFINEAVNSGNPWEYALVVLGNWKIFVPWAVKTEYLVKHDLITFFNIRFFIPWLIDIVLFLASAFALAKWFKQLK
jgi:hypothetical protein